MNSTAVQGNALKLVLIANAEFGTTYGLNILFSVARQMDIDVSLVYLKEVNEGKVFVQRNINRPNGVGCLRFTDDVLEQVLGICSDADLIGISLLTANYANSVQITQELRKGTNAPIVWGGKHASINPDECLEHADIVCVGEAEDSFGELLDSVRDGDIPKDIPGLRFRNGQSMQPREVRKDISCFPHPDYTPDGKYLLESGRLRPITEEDVAKMLVKYPTMIARGCPMRCAFCTNSAHDKPALRVREPHDIINELQAAIKRFPTVRRVFFRDDTVMSLPLDYTAALFAEYKSRIGLPFTCSGVIPTAVTWDKTKVLVDAGLEGIKMGIQSGSRRIRKEVYNRPESDARVFESAQILAGSGTGTVLYMFITDCPWETDEDRIASVRMVSRLPRPFQLSVYSLDLYPGTQLYYRAMEEGIIESGREHYNKSTMTVENHYLNQLLMLQLHRMVAPWRIRLLTWKPLCRSRLFRRVFERLFRATFNTISEYGIDRKRVAPRCTIDKILGVFFDTLVLGQWGRTLKAISMLGRSGP